MRLTGKRAFATGVLVLACCGAGCAGKPAPPPGPGLLLQPVRSFSGVKIPANAWSPDGRAFALLHTGGGLSVVHVEQPDSAPRRITNRQVEGLAWSPGGTRLALRVPTRWRPGEIHELDVLIAENDSVVRSLPKLGDVQDLVWLSDTSLWVRRGTERTLEHLASFAPRSGAPVAEAWLTWMPVSLDPAGPLLAGPRAALPSTARPITGAPDAAMLEAPGFKDHLRLATNAATRRFLARHEGGDGGAELLDSAGTERRSFPPGRGTQAMDARSLGADGTIVLGLAPNEDSQKGGPTAIRAVAVDGWWPVTEVEGPKVTDVQGAPRGEYVLLQSAGVWLARLVVGHGRAAARLPQAAPDH